MPTRLTVFLFAIFLNSLSLFGSAVDFDCPENPVFVDSIFTCDSEWINLMTYLPTGIDFSGEWLDPNGSLIITGIIDPNTALSGTYSYHWMDSEECPLFAEIIVLFIPDTDDDGICDSDEIVGCQDPDASNYNPNATDPGPCTISPFFDEDPPSAIVEPEGGELGGRPTVDFLVYPNPLKGGDLTVVFDQPVSGGQLVAHDLLGKVIWRKNLSQEQQLFSIPSQNFIAEGVYLISFISSDGTVSHKRLLVSK